MIKTIQKYIINHQLFFEIMLITMLFMSILSIVLTTIIIDSSSKSYVGSYVDSNQLILERTTIEYENLHNSINTLLTNVKDSSEVKQFLSITKNELIKDKYTTYYNFDRFFDAQSVTLYQNIPYQMVFVGLNGQTFYSNNAVQTLTVQELLTQPITKKLETAPTLITSVSVDYQLIKRSKSESVILSGTGVTDSKNNHLIGYVFLEITEADFASIYDKLISPNVNTIYVADSSQQIISANQKSLIHTKQTEQKNRDVIQQQLPISSFDFSITSQIQQASLKREMNIWPKAISITLLTFSLLLLLLFFYLRKILNPIYQLIATTPKIVAGNFNQKVPISGTHEIKKLISSYNYLQDGLNLFMQQLIYTEKEKRRAEIRALQLNIKPHFIYNTLTSIKFLIFENRNEDSITALDAFIHLLEQTVYNNDEMIPLKQELAILNDLSVILNTRYGNRVQFLAFVPDELLQLQIPKLLLQPFVENAFIHGFPNKKTGSICVTARQTEAFITIEIMDTGIGFYQDERLNTQNQNFSGIGIHNVQERLALIYNDLATLTIESKNNQGTIVTIKLPI